MKKLLLFAFAFWLVSLAALAQDYAPFKPGRTPYFQAGDSIYSLRITNAFVQGNDSVFEFNPRVVPTNSSTATAGCSVNNIGLLRAARTVNNIFGEKMVKTTSGYYQFIFISGDTFLLKPHAAIGESWPFWQSVTATLQSRTADLVQGLPDTIVTIALSNGQEIKLAKQFGLVSSQSFVFYLQPLINPGVLQLKRLPEAGVGQPLSNVFQIFDFNPGDKFLYKSERYSSGGSQCADGKRTVEVLSRYNSPGGDTVRYELKEQVLSQTWGHPSAPPEFCNGTNEVSLSPFYNLTLEITATIDAHVNTLAREYGSYTTNAFTVSANSGQFVSDFNTRWGSHFLEYRYDSCSAIFFEVIDYFGSESFAEGLGKTYWITGGWGYNYEQLIAYIKGSETYGNWQPLVLSAEEEVIQNPLQVFPNPFSSEITLQLPEATSEPAEITVFNLQGQRVYQQKVTDLPLQTGLKVALPSLPAGLYLLHLNQGDNLYSAKVQRQ